VVVLERVFDRVYRVILPLPFRGVNTLNVYLLKKEKPAIIDTGLGDQLSIEKVLQGIKDAGVGLEDVEYILTTHEHIEHFGGNREIKEKTGAEVCAHSAAADSIEHFHESVLELGRLVEKMEIPRVEKEMLKMAIRANIMVKTVKVDRRLEDGDTVNLGSRELRVIHTPGHSMGHVCFYDEADKVLFTGDHVLGEGTPFVGAGFGGAFYGLGMERLRFRGWFEGDLALYIESLKKLLNLEVKTILPAHGGVVSDPYKRINETLKRKLFRERKLLRILRKGRTDLDSIIEKLYGQVADKYILRGSTLGYLSKLIKEGKASFTLEEGKIYFELTEA